MSDPSAPEQSSRFSAYASKYLSEPDTSSGNDVTPTTVCALHKYIDHNVF